MIRFRPRQTKKTSRPRRPGAVLVLTLLGIFLLAGLTMYVLNLGRHVTARVVAQHSADAAAVAGAGWMARTFNTVAMNNVGIARLIALCAVVDAMPQATDFALADQSGLHEAVEAQLRRGVPDTWVRLALEQARGQLAQEVATLEAAQLQFESRIDLTELTHYRTDSGQLGGYWQAMLSMDELSQSAMNALPTLAPFTADFAGRVNVAGSEQESALLLPGNPQVPWERGSFAHFERPVREGLLREGVDHRYDRRGPFDALFGWREARPETESFGGIGYAGRVPIGRGQRSTRTVVVGPPDHYEVRGVFHWTRHNIGNRLIGALPMSRIRGHLGRLGRIKLAYAWPDEGNPPTAVHRPEWETDFAAATQRAADGEPIRGTAFLVVEVKSRFPVGHPYFMTPGSWAYVMTTGRPTRVVRSGRWMDPRNWGVPRVNDYIWRDAWDYEVVSDPSIGLPPQVDDDGELVMQPVYRIDSFVFAGIDTGSSTPVGHPFNFDAGDALPAPIDLVHEQVPPGADTRRAYFTMLGLVQREDPPLMWPRQFGGGRPYGPSVAMAQAFVFNNHSHDLWTQMWHAQLEPVTDYDGWMQVMAEQSEAVVNSHSITAEQYDDLRVYLQSISPMAEITLTH